MFSQKTFDLYTNNLKTKIFNTIYAYHAVCVINRYFLENASYQR